MREWSLQAEDPYVLMLAADARFCTPDYADDQSWEIHLAGGDPPALSLSTSFGRRARSMRLFPFVSLAGRHATDPGRFAAAPSVRRFLPNYACVESRPFADLALASEVWVPELHALAGRMAITNLSAAPLQVRLGVHVQLKPHETGRPASPANVRGVTVLAGRAGNLTPVLFLSGGAVLEPSPIPALAVSLTLAPGARRMVPWAHAARTSLDESFDLAREVAARAWDPELARLEIAEAEVLEFETGNRDWDAVLAFSQHAGLRAFFGSTRYLRHPSFVASRQPDFGYSERGDGRDHPSSWSGQDPARSAYVIGLTRHAAPDLALGVIRNFLNSQAPDGSIDWRPGLAGQRHGSLCIPWLADWVHAWCVEVQDWGLARESLPRLLEFYRVWFSPAHDRDQDGHPEWDHASQAYADDSAPSYMALGATWNPSNAEDLGRVAGQELSALGMNLLLGPSLDVRTQPSTSVFDPGVNVFSGDPHWTGIMGEAYARGLQTGSAGRLAVTAKHFPGQGSLNDVSFTIDRSLDDLKKIDLPPFERLMLNPIDQGRPLADALLTTNARYRGFDGNIRERTAPLSLDSAALQTLLDQPEAKAWRDRGGLLISDAPGSVMVREYYSATASSGAVSVTQAALEAFQAGNDMLLLDNLRPGDDAQAIRDVISAFRQKYSTDPAFQQRVDSAVQRILRLKYRLYPSYDVTQVVVPVAQVRSQMDTGEAASAQVAREAATLLWPRDQQALPSIEPTDSVLIAADMRTIRECSTCLAVQTLNPADLANAISSRYGVPAANITTTTYSELKAFVTGAANAPDLTPAFNAVKWVFVAQQTFSPVYPESDAAQLLLDQRADLLNGKRLIGFMFGPPYGFTTQQITRFTALYGLYGKLASNIDAAVQALDVDTLPGRSPVNIPALNYDLTVQTEPDPTQTIPLMVGEAAVPGQPTPDAVILRVGDRSVIRAGTIVDRNGHPVPDDTPVEFSFQYDGDPAPKIQESMTLDGTARTEFVLEKVGRLLIRASSEPARDSTVLEITISESGGAIVATVVPTPTPTPTRIPTATHTPTSTPTPTITPQPGPVEAFFTHKPRNAQWGELILALISVAAIGGGGYWAMRQRRGDLARALRVGLWCASGGLIGYVYFTLGLPGTDLLRVLLNSWGVLLCVALGGILPLLYWLRRG